MLNETLNFDGCDIICGQIEELSAAELLIDAFVTTTVSAPAK